MGYMSALGMAELAGASEAALTWHLRSNHFPPLPHALITVAQQAISYAEDGDWDVALELPEGMLFRGRDTVTVAEAVESMHLDAFITEAL